MKIAFDIDPSNPSDLNAALALLVKLGAVYTPTKHGAHLTVPVEALAAADSPDAGLDVVNPDTAFGDSAPPLDLAAANQAFEGNVAPPAPPLTPPVGTPPAPPNGVPTAGANTPDLDKYGLPWDGRIHAGTKGKNKDQSWTAKRGRDENIVHAVEQELRALMAVPSPAAVVTPPPPPPALAAVHTLPSPEVLPGQPAAPVAPGPLTFASIVQKIAALKLQGVLTDDDVAGALAAAGVPNLPVAAARPDLLVLIDTTIEQIAGARRAAQG